MSIVIFDLGNTLRAYRHKLIGLKRRLTGQKGNTYVQQYLADPACATEFNPRESSLTCHICGFQMVELVSAQDWTIELCPAQWKSCIGDREFLKKWLADLVGYPRIIELGTNLQIKLRLRTKLRTKPRFDWH